MFSKVEAPTKLIFFCQDFTKQQYIIRDEESELLKKKNILSKEVYAEKVKALNVKINAMQIS